MRLSKKQALYESGRIVYIAVGRIAPNPAQPRSVSDDSALTELASSIKRYGVLQPISVRRRGKDFELIAGERRLRASVLAGLQSVPCVIIDVGDEDSSLLALIENLQRKDLDFIEEARGIAKLISVFGMSQEDAARKLGKSQPAIANKLRILKLPEDILLRLRSGNLSERHGRALLRLPEDGMRRAALEKMLEKHMNVAQAEAYIDSLLAERLRPKKHPSYTLRDVRPFLNSVINGVSTMQRSGIDAELEKSETESQLILKVTIPK